MTAITSCQTLSLIEAAKLLPKTDGKRVQPSTVWRWCRIGIKARNGERIRLGHSRLGRRVVTSRQALDAFGRALTLADKEHFQGTAAVTNDRPRPRTDAQRRAAIDQAERDLEAGGLNR